MGKSRADGGGVYKGLARASGPTLSRRKKISPSQRYF